MLPLFSDRLDIRGDHVGSHGHRTDLVPSVGDGLSGDELLVHLGVGFGLKGRFHKGDV